MFPSYLSAEYDPQGVPALVGELFGKRNYGRSGMRITVSSLKGERRAPKVKEMPSEGTKMRLIWEELFARAGKAVSARELEEKIGLKKYKVLDFFATMNATYELDIRCLGNGYWVLAGRLDGDKYIDYVAMNQ